jgi:hypothetical protein
VNCEDIGVAMMSTADCPEGRKDDCGLDDACLPLGADAPKMGLCARRSFERRSCARSCSGDGDCRDGYECRLAGIHGSLSLLPPPAAPRFCAPRPL